MIKPIISMIAAMGSDRTIGKDNNIPWDIPEDMEFLRETTRGKPLIMGRTTYESICNIRKIDGKIERAMPGRLNVVITRDCEYFKNGTPDGVMLAISPKQGINLAYDFASNAGMHEIFVFGGAEIYKQLLPDAQRMYLTEIDRDFNGDTFFPEFDKSKWQQIKNDQHDGFAFNTYDRIKP